MFEAKNAKAPSRHRTQYFEMMGQWALYHDGWFLSTKVNRAPWQAFGPANADPLNNQVFQLYDLNKDFTQSDDIAAKFPQKVAEMRRMFVAEAKKHQVLPLDASVWHRRAAAEHHRRPQRVRLYAADDRTAAGRFAAAAEHVLHDHRRHRGAARRRRGHRPTSGGRFGGYGFYLLNGKPVFLWDMVDLERLKWEAPDALSPGRHAIEFDFKYDGMGAGTLAFNNFSGVGRPGVGTLKVDGNVVATKKMDRTLPMILQWDESFDIGSDTLTGVNDADYRPPFEFTGKLNKLTIKVDRPKLSPEEIKKLQAAMKEKAASD